MIGQTVYQKVGLTWGRQRFERIAAKQVALNASLLMLVFAALALAQVAGSAQLVPIRTLHASPNSQRDPDGIVPLVAEVR